MHCFLNVHFCCDIPGSKKGHRLCLPLFSSLQTYTYLECLKNLLQFEVKRLCLMLILEIFVVVFGLQFIKQPYDICNKCTITCSKIILQIIMLTFGFCFLEIYFF